VTATARVTFLGVVLGVSWLDSDLLVELEGRPVIEQVTGDPCNMFDERPITAIDWDGYPPLCKDSRVRGWCPRRSGTPTSNLPGPDM
jgi:hypothetical protein